MPWPLLWWKRGWRRYQNPGALPIGSLYGLPTSTWFYGKCRYMDPTGDIAIFLHWLISIMQSSYIVDGWCPSCRISYMAYACYAILWTEVTANRHDHRCLWIEKGVTKTADWDGNWMLCSIRVLQLPAIWGWWVQNGIVGWSWSASLCGWYSVTADWPSS